MQDDLADIVIRTRGHQDIGGSQALAQAFEIGVLADDVDTFASRLFKRDDLFGKEIGMRFRSDDAYKHNRLR